MDCFLCAPPADLVYAQSESFFAMLGWGPIGEGYSLIASKAHIPSMMDLSRQDADELQGFTTETRERLDPLFGPASLTEHGRIAACLEQAAGEHEPHCLHAHRLVFPGILDLEVTAKLPRLDWRSFESFAEARRAFRWDGQYLYSETPNGVVTVAPVSGPVPRQLFRGIAALQVGAPELAGWRAKPRIDVVEAAAARLKAGA